jgi:hypothetical protein
MLRIVVPSPTARCRSAVSPTPIREGARGIMRSIIQWRSVFGDMHPRYCSGELIHHRYAKLSHHKDWCYGRCRSFIQ